MNDHLDRPIPPQLQKLIDAWDANAREAEMPEGACFVDFEQEQSCYVREYYRADDGVIDYRRRTETCHMGPAWEIACNFERGPILRWFPEQDLWFEQSRYGDCKKLKHGLSSALEIAGMAYTG